MRPGMQSTDPTAPAHVGARRRAPPLVADQSLGRADAQHAAVRQRGGPTLADRLLPARVRALDHAGQRIPVAAAGHEPYEGGARVERRRGGGRSEETARGPEVGVGVRVVVVEEVQEAQVALERAAVALLVGAERLLLGRAVTQYGACRASAEEACEACEMNAGREHRIDEAGGVACQQPARAPEPCRVV